MGGSRADEISPLNNLIDTAEATPMNPHVDPFIQSIVMDIARPEWDADVASDVVLTSDSPNDLISVFRKGNKTDTRYKAEHRSTPHSYQRATQTTHKYSVPRSRYEKRLPSRTCSVPQPLLCMALPARAALGCSLLPLPLASVRYAYAAVMRTGIHLRVPASN